jgi:hypothetical protein
MKKTSSFLTGFLAMLVAAGLLSSAGTTQAAIVGFQGPYAPVNWTLTTNGGDGSVDTSGAPTSISLFGSNTESLNPILTDFTTLAAGDGTISFSWDYATGDGAAQLDPFGYLLDGVFTKLTDDFRGSQNGNASFSVLAGQAFGFRIDTLDDYGGRAQSTISSFEAPGAAVPEPGTWAAAALLAGGAAFMRWRKRTKVA